MKKGGIFLKRGVIAKVDPGNKWFPLKTVVFTAFFRVDFLKRLVWFVFDPRKEKKASQI